MTISLCMIVKNEEDVLARCLDSIADLVDEIIIVDTGSTDSTKEVAARYTGLIYDFEWIQDFSAARNFAFSKATKDYIYSADADEVLDETNRERFRLLKEALLPEIEIVQMKYGNQLSYGTVYNFDEEYRPKLFKRLRSFVWEEAIHEQVRLNPVVFDSDIVITHMPKESHSGRDLAVFRRETSKGGRLSTRLENMYERELFLNGTAEDFAAAEGYFAEVAETQEDAQAGAVASLMVAKSALARKDIPQFFKYIMKSVIGSNISEACLVLGGYYEETGDYEEACMWYYNAAYETECVLSLRAGHTEPLEALVRIYNLLGNSERAAFFNTELAARKQLIAQMDGNC